MKNPSQKDRNVITWIRFFSFPFPHNVDEFFSISQSVQNKVISNSRDPCETYFETNLDCLQFDVLQCDQKWVKRLLIVENITKETQMEFCERRRSHFVQHHRALILFQSENEENKRPSSSYAKLTRAEIARSIVFTDLKERTFRRSSASFGSWLVSSNVPLVDSVVSRAILKKSGGVVVVPVQLSRWVPRDQLSASGTATLASDLLCSSTAYASAVSKARSTTYSAVPQALTRLIAAALDRARRENPFALPREGTIATYLLDERRCQQCEHLSTCTDSEIRSIAWRVRSCFRCFAGIGDDGTWAGNIMTISNDDEARV